MKKSHDAFSEFRTWTLCSPKTVASENRLSLFYASGNKVTNEVHLQDHSLLKEMMQPWDFLQLKTWLQEKFCLHAYMILPFEISFEREYLLIERPLCVIKPNARRINGWIESWSVIMTLPDLSLCNPCFLKGAFSRYKYRGRTTEPRGRTTEPQ